MQGDAGQGAAKAELIPGGPPRIAGAERKRERERGTTLQSHDCPEVRRAPGSWRHSLAPAAPCPSFPAGEVPVALPPRDEARKIRDRARAQGGARSLLCPRPVVSAHLLGEGPPSTVMVVLAPTAAPQSGPPGTIRTVRASALTLLDHNQGHAQTRATARGRGGVGRTARGSWGSICGVVPG